MLSSGTAVLLKFDILHSFENYIRSAYYKTFPLTMYFQVQFITVSTILAIPKIPLNMHWKESDCQQSQKNISLTKTENIKTIQKRKGRKLKRNIIRMSQ